MSTAVVPETAGEDLTRWPLIQQVSSPQELRRVPGYLLPELASQIRDFLIEKVCATGGHLGVNLGVIELTLALHRVFDSPRDPLVFDVGHQIYVHKIVTGRAHEFGTLRRGGGLSGYAARGESAHDWVENSHASTALSYADGLANGFQTLRRTDRTVVAVIGDGGLTGGLAWEGLNNLAVRAHRPVVVVVNDNGRSYDPTVGGVAAHLRALRSAETGTVSLFEQFGLTYLGPVDGHDVGAVESALRQARGLRRTAVVHVVTEKGLGYPPAELDRTDRLHAIGVLDPHTGQPTRPPRRSWTTVFGEELERLADRRTDIVCVTAAMLQPVGLRRFARAHPDRVFDVGIAEQHAVCSAAGLAMSGLHPVVAVYSTFLNRAFDQMLLDVALHGLAVTFVVDRAGITGPDGASHHGLWDTGLLGLVPGMRVAAPRDTARLRELLREALDHDGPTAVRIPKVTAGEDIPAISEVAGLDVLSQGPHRGDVLIVCAGVTAEIGLAAAALVEKAGHHVTVVDPRWVHPVPPPLVHLAGRHRAVVTVEDTVVTGGLGAGLVHHLAAIGSTVSVRTVGVDRQFLRHGTRDDLLAASGICPDRVAATAVEVLATTPPPDAAREGRNLP
nr:1-deoxy-D-xylulose-5-phosphate synthase [Nocardia wallacei]